MPTTDGGSFLSGVVLAAGASTRMGRPKQLLPVGDRCLLRRVIDAALASRLDEVIVVLGHRADEIGSALALDAVGRARVVVNSEHADGQSTSLRCGLRAADERAQAVADDVRVVSRAMEDLSTTGTITAVAHRSSR